MLLKCKDYDLHVKKYLIDPTLKILYQPQLIEIISKILDEIHLKLVNIIKKMPLINYYSAYLK